MTRRSEVRASLGESVSSIKGFLIPGIIGWRSPGPAGGRQGTFFLLNPTVCILSGYLDAFWLAAKPGYERTLERDMERALQRETDRACALPRAVCETEARAAAAAGEGAVPTPTEAQK